MALFPAPREARCAACVLRSMAARRKTTLGWIGISPKLGLLSLARATLRPRLLRRPASEPGRLRHGDGAHGSGACWRRGLGLPIALESFR